MCRASVHSTNKFKRGKYYDYYKWISIKKKKKAKPIKTLRGFCFDGNSIRSPHVSALSGTDDKPILPTLTELRVNEMHVSPRAACFAKSIPIRFFFFIFCPRRAGFTIVVFFHKRAKLCQVLYTLLLQCRIRIMRVIKSTSFDESF